MPQAKAAFEYPGFRYYMMARFLITASSEMQSVAIGWQVYNLTHRPRDLGLVGLSQFLPGILLFLVAGHAADRFPRQRILQICFAAFSAVSLLLLALAMHGLHSVWPIYGVLVLNGTVRAFNMPTGQAFLPQLVKERDFPNAVAWSSSILQGALTIGPMAGGLVYGLAGTPLPVYGTAAASYLIGLALISRIRVELPQRPRGTASTGVLLEGLRFIWREKVILGAISLDLFAVLLGGAVALLPIYAKDILHAGTTGLGILRAAPGCGAIVMAIFVANRPITRNAGRNMLGCVFVFGLLTIVFGLSRNIAVSLVALMLLGACDMVSVIIRHTVVQLGTPDAMRGRVSSVNMVFIGASNEVGQFESGITAEWFGTVPAVVLGGIGTLVVVTAGAWLFPALRNVDRLPGAVSDSADATLRRPDRPRQ
ncbi:MAG: MFS transporter [Ignavibacteriota bacterium]